MSASERESVHVNGIPLVNSYENRNGALVIYDVDDADSEWVRAGNPWEAER